MTTLRPTVPASVPQAPGANGPFTGDVTASPVTDSTALDTKPDARTNPPPAANSPASADKPATTTTAVDNAQDKTLPANANYQQQKGKKKKKTKNPPADQQQQQPPPASTTTPAPSTSQQ